MSRWLTFVMIFCFLICERALVRFFRLFWQYFFPSFPDILLECLNSTRLWSVSPLEPIYWVSILRIRQWEIINNWFLSIQVLLRFFEQDLHLWQPPLLRIYFCLKLRARAATLLGSGGQVIVAFFSRSQCKYSRFISWKFFRWERTIRWVKCCLVSCVSCWSGHVGGTFTTRTVSGRHYGI